MKAGYGRQEMRQSRNLVEELLAIGAHRGLSAADIAARAGMSPTNLSRVRRTGRYNADTLERLAGAVDAEIGVRPRARDASRTLPLIVKKLNAGRRERLREDELRRLLTRFRSSALADRAYSHLVGIVEELPLEQVHQLVIEGDATLPSLLRIAAFVEGRGPTVEWIHERMRKTRRLESAS